jgi:hypothetical protein
VRALPRGETPRGLEVRAGEVRDRYERDLRHGLRDAEDLRRLRLVEEMVRRPGGADPASAEREHERPHGGQDRAVEGRLHGDAGILEAPLDAGQHEDRDLVEMILQVHRGSVHPRELTRAEVVRRIGWPCLVHLREEVVPAAVEVREAEPLLGIRHDHEMPALGVRARRCLERALDAPFEDFALDGAPDVESPADGAGGGEQPVDGREIHGAR